MKKFTIMNTELDYNILIEKAMRNVVKLALKKAQKIKDDNLCFLFVVNTKHKKVVMPDYIKRQYPEEITLILQHQFANLDVSNNYFSVDLSFSGRIEKIIIPFNAILVFTDQKAGIELRFDIIDNGEFDTEYDYEYEPLNIEHNSANINIDYSDNLINFKDLQGK